MHTRRLTSALFLYTVLEPVLSSYGVLDARENLIWCDWYYAKDRIHPRSKV